MSVINVFLKQDERGARKPTVWTWALLCALIFGSFFLSQQNTKPVKKRAKAVIINERQIVEAANSYSNKEDALAAEPSEGSYKTERHRRKPNREGSSKMIVFDGTKDYLSDELVPLGSMVKCLLIHNIVTNNFNAPVIAQVWEDFYFDGKLLLPFGTRIYGTAFAGRQRDRVMVQFHTIVFQDGKTIKISAIGLSQDGSGGLTGTVIDNRTKKISMEMAINFLGGLAAGLQQTTTNVVTGLTQIESSSRNAILNGVANTFQKEAERVRQETEGAKGFAIVLAGTQLVVYFEKEADIHPF